ncbi:MAG: diacylglycerol kinase, partial [Bacteroidales bacterium]|nr:diacylglycerol kinase [Bacteroidales bacterium]
TDIVHPDHDPRAGLVKDLAAGAVLITAIAAAIVGFLIFIPKIIILL